MQHRFTFAILVALTALVGACGEEDDSPPAPPIVDPISAPASDSTVTVSGTAEFSATVRLTVGSSTVETVADPYTARWFADVTITAADDSVTVVAIDAAGNESEPTVADIDRACVPAMVDLSLDSNAVTAGTDVGYTATVEDSCGQASDAVVSVYTNAPGAVVAGGTITGLARSGTYTVVAEVPGTGVVDTEMLVVDPDASTAVLVLRLAQSTAYVGVPLAFDAIVVDGFGNPVDASSLVVTTTDDAACGGSCVDMSTRTITFASVGGPSHTVTATLFPGEQNQVADSEAVLVTNPDLAAPQVAITAPANGLEVRPGSIITVTVEASDAHGLVEVAFQASGAEEQYDSVLIPVDAQGAPQTAVTVDFNLDVGGNRVGNIALVAQATDASGNVSTSAQVVIRAEPALNINVASGFSIETVTGNGLINGPRGVAIDAAGDIYVANNGGGSAVVRVDPATGAQTSFVPEIASAGPEDILYDPGAGAYFLSARGIDRVYRIDSAGIADTFATVGARPAGMSFDPVTSELVVLHDDRRLRRFDPDAAALPTGPTFTMDAGGILDRGWGLAALGAGFVAVDTGNDRVWSFEAPAASGDPVVNQSFLAGSPPLDVARDVVVAASGRAYVANEGDGRLIEIDLPSCTGVPCPTRTIATGFDTIWGLELDAAGGLVITDEGDDLVFRMTGPF